MWRDSIEYVFDCPRLVAGVELEVTDNPFDYSLAPDDFRKTGDADFDARVRVSGDDAHCVAVLDEHTRVAIRRAAGSLKLRLDQRRLTLSGRERRFGGARPERDTIRAGLELVRELRLSEDEIPGRLRDIAVQDSNGEVARAAYSILQRDFAGSDEANEAAVVALVSDEPGLRILAARDLGDEGRLTLIDIAGDLRAGADERAWAITGLAERNAEGLDALLPELARGGPPVVSAAAVAAMAAISHPDIVPVCEDLLRGADEELQIAVAAAMQVSGDGAGELVLNELLQSENPSVLSAVVRALGAIGSIRSMPAIAPLAQRSYRWPHVKREARHAVREIAARSGVEGAAVLEHVDDWTEVAALVVANSNDTQPQDR